MCWSSFKSKKWYSSINILFPLSTIFIILQFLLPSTVIASAADSRYQFGNSAALDKGSVSVVRLVAQYISTPALGKGTPAVGGCIKTVIGLGALVGSWATKPGSTDYSNWVLTDGSLINPNGIPCGANKPAGQLSSVQIYLNNAYTSVTFGLILKSLQCQATSCSDGAATDTITCQIPVPCEKGAVLLPFHTTAPEPFIDMAPQDQVTPAPFGIELTGPVFPPVSVVQAAQDLEPVPATISATVNEPGMLIVSSDGQLLDMHTKEVDVGQKIRTFVTAELAPAPVQPQHTNKLHDSWNQGILDFYTNHLITARFEFNKAGAANPQFRAPAAFLALPQMTAVLTPTPSTGGSKTPPATVPAAFNVWFPWIIVGTILLIAILILIVAMVLGGQSRRRQELATFEMDRAAAEQKAALEVQRQAVFFTKRSVNPANQNAQTKTDLRCPNCGQTVRAGDKFCSQCRSPLVLSDSGLHVRLATPQEIQGLPQAAINARRITELEHLEAEKQKQPAPPLVAHTNPAENVAQENYTQSLAEPLCPHCHKSVQINATFCANCGFSLSPSAGFQTRVTALPAIDAEAFLPTSSVSIQSPHDLAQEQVQEDKQQEEKASSRLGQRLGNYQLIRLLGEGGFAEVYLGEHIHLGSHAAIKVLHSQLTSDEREKFRLEARTLVRLVHPHIVRVLEFRIEDKTPFLVMDFAVNGTLRQRHPKGTRLPLAMVNSYVQQVADALQFAHDQKIIHRDIKPENMLVSQLNTILLSDFGIATVALSSRYQNVQDMAGTIAYMAPEQIQSYPRPASDQYALGVVVYEWLCGTRPFHGSFTEIAIKHAVVPPPPLSKYVPALPTVVEEVVLKALAKDPKDRFTSVQAFAKALAQAI